MIAVTRGGRGIARVTVVEEGGSAGQVRGVRELFFVVGSGSIGNLDFSKGAWV